MCISDYRFGLRAWWQRLGAREQLVQHKASECSRRGQLEHIYYAGQPLLSGHIAETSVVGRSGQQASRRRYLAHITRARPDPKQRLPRSVQRDSRAQGFATEIAARVDVDDTQVGPPAAVSSACPPRTSSFNVSTGTRTSRVLIRGPTTSDQIQLPVLAQIRHQPRVSVSLCFSPRHPPSTPKALLRMASAAVDVSLTLGAFQVAVTITMLYVVDLPCALCAVLTKQPLASSVFSRCKLGTITGPSKTILGAQRSLYVGEARLTQAHSSFQVAGV